jgi:hypothetical protein
LSEPVGVADTLDKNRVARGESRIATEPGEGSVIALGVGEDETVGVWLTAARNDGPSRGGGVSGVSHQTLPSR